MHPHRFITALPTRPTLTDLTGSLVSDYRVLRRLGRGAMAEVYLAEQQSLSRQVALKVLTAELANQKSYVERFQHEARSVASLVHANIVQVYEVGQSNGSHFIAQEYVAGQNLAEWMNRHGQVEPGRALDILRQVTAALCKADERSIVHRDIKPENIMLARDGQVKVADFGLARANTAGGPDDATARTQAGIAMGTPLYMSPEQIEGRPVDSRSDIYSLGVTAYHMLAGSPPFAGDTPLAVAMKHVNSPPPALLEQAPGTPAELVALIERMMSKTPAERYENPQALLRALRELAKSAASDGWAEGPENWSLSDFAATTGSEIEATGELNQLMREARKLTPPQINRRRMLAVVAVSLIAGGALAAVLQRPYVLASSQPEVLAYDTPLAQLFHAKMVDSPDAWQAVLRRFPTADSAIRYQAHQGLARYYLRNADYRRALPHLDELAAAPTSERTLRAFALVGLSVAHAELGNMPESQAARQLIATGDIDLLDYDRELVEKFQALAR